MSDKAVSVLEDFHSKGTLPNTQDLVRSYLTAAMVRVYIADMFDDFVYSDKTVAGNAIGDANMSGLYDQAVALLDKASALADPDNKVKVLGLKARAVHAKAVWDKVNPTVNTGSPYVNAGVTEARAALALMSADYKWKMLFSGSTVSNNMSWQINGRLEMDLLYNEYLASIGKEPGDPQANDLVTGEPDSRITALAAEFRDISGGTDYAPITVISSREMTVIGA